MQKRYKEVFDDIGTHKMHMLRASIEEKEHNIKNCEKALEQARDQLTQEQDTIETVLAEWREKASFLRATHGGVSQPVTPEAEILLAALHLFETVRDKGSKAQAVIKISEMQNMRISELISLLPQDV